jgi:hypothetical protein
MGIFFQARVWRIISLRRLPDGSHAEKHKDHSHDRSNRAKDSDGNDRQIIPHPVAWRRDVGYQYFCGPDKARHH